MVDVLAYFLIKRNLSDTHKKLFFYLQNSLILSQKIGIILLNNSIWSLLERLPNNER